MTLHIATPAIIVDADHRGGLSQSRSHRFLGRLRHVFGVPLALTPSEFQQDLWRQKNRVSSYDAALLRDERLAVFIELRL